MTGQPTPSRVAVITSRPRQHQHQPETGYAWLIFDAGGELFNYKCHLPGNGRAARRTGLTERRGWRARSGPDGRDDAVRPGRRVGNRRPMGLIGSPARPVLSPGWDAERPGLTGRAAIGSGELGPGHLPRGD